MDLVADMERRLEGEGYARRTIVEYVKWGRRLARWAQLHGMTTAELQPHHVRHWIDETVPQGRESRKQAYTTLRHLYAEREDEPWLAIQVPRKRRGSPNPLPEPERVALRDAASLVGGRRGLAVVGLLQTAARPSEVAAWRWDGLTRFDAPDESGSVGRLRFYRTKVRDWHEVPVRPLLGEALERFRTPYAEGFLFPGNNGRPHVTPKTVSQWVVEVAEVAGLQGVCARRLRATALSRVLEVTESIDVAAEIAGHRDLEVTRTYYVATSWSRLAGGAAALD